MATSDIINLLGLSTATLANSSSTSDAIDSITRTQTDAIDKAGSLYEQGAGVESEAILRAAGISADAAREAGLIASEYYDKALAQQDSSMDYQQKMLGMAVDAQQPFYNQGTWALQELRQMMESWDSSPEAYERSPYYDFIQSETIKGLDQSAASKGKLLSGAQDEAVMGYSKDLASTDYDNWINRYYQSLSPYQTLASMGQGAANQITNAAMNSGNAVAGVYNNKSNLLADQGQTLAGYTNQAGNAEAQGESAAGAVQGDLFSQLAGLETDRGDVSAYGQVNQANNDTNTVNALAGVAGQFLEPTVNAVGDFVSNWLSTPSSTNIEPAAAVSVPDSYWDASDSFANENINALSRYYL